MFSAAFYSWFSRTPYERLSRPLHFLFCYRRPTVLFRLHTHPVSWNCAYHLLMELSGGGCLPNLVRKCRWTIVTDRHSWNVSTQNVFSLPFAAILLNCAPSGEMQNYCAPSGEMHNYCTPHIINRNFENFLLHRCNDILLSQVYCLWQVVKTPTIIWNNPLYQCAQLSVML